MRALLLITGAIVFLGFAAEAQNLPRRGNPQMGAQLALRTCDACHIVARNQEYPPLVQGYAPSFFDIANQPGMTAADLQEFLLHPHVLARMPYPDLTIDQIADVAAYILSLRGRR
jgi:mono/diheme cytochrome c family protein